MKIQVLLTLALLSFSTMVQAQPKAVVKARQAFISENYSDAASKCTQAYQKLTRKGKMAKKMKGEMAYMTAECYRQTERYRDAHEWYDRAITLDYFDYVPEVYLYNVHQCG